MNPTEGHSRLDSHTVRTRIKGFLQFLKGGTLIKEPSNLKYFSHYISNNNFVED